MAGRLRQDALNRAYALTGADRAVFDVIVSQVGPLMDWPFWFIDLVTAPHLKYQNRFCLTTFLLQNACMPQVIAEWMMQRKMLKDQSARDHVANMLAQFQKGQLKVTAYKLPCNVTVNTKPVCKRSHAWDGVGDPVVPPATWNPATKRYENKFYQAFKFPLWYDEAILSGEWALDFNKAINMLKLNDVKAKAAPLYQLGIGSKKGEYIVKIVPWAEDYLDPPPRPDWLEPAPKRAKFA